VPAAAAGALGARSMLALPAFGVSAASAALYARWLSERTGRSYRLPSEDEWEKAARGTDGRIYPGGDRDDASFCHARAGERDPTGVTTAAATPVDQCVYGACGFGGNVRNWCAASPDANAKADVAEAPVRGGSFRLSMDAARAAARSTLPRVRGHLDVGVRLARTLDPTESD
jgi:formylglycine-generating enzyme required for sulfatase activity